MSPRKLVIKLLDRLERTDAYADLILENELREQKLLEEEKALTQEIFFGVIRWRNRLNWIIKNFYQGPIDKSPRFIRYILLSSLYQLLCMDRIPDYAIINEAVELAKLKGGSYWGKKVNAILRSFQRNGHQINWPDRSSKPVEYISVYYSHPEWLVDRWIKRFGVEETISLCQANNKNPELSLRANKIKTSTNELQNLLSNVPTTRSNYLENFLLAKKLPNLSQFEPFQHGKFSIQDTSAGLACTLLAPKPGEKIIDLCAAPGGKTTFLAELTGDRASIFAIDLNKSRLLRLRQNLNRLGLKSVQLIQADGTQFSCQKIDRVIVDAPCSGLGVLSKRVDLRWKRTLEQIEELSRLQLKLITNAANLLKSGGVLVYCTCTIEPEENEHIIKKFLVERNDFHIEPTSKYVSTEITNSDGYLYTFPHRHEMDGSFAARLVRA
ncbi:MAG: 16S rRNA (cytosine(967)-C(5))-methyltransferase RsmB [bacterium]|nr:MAG: 16S rRNA (cytosine(967)-C(5))-methyltransferase RsmB [bacterium]